jgi:hypothetical protein
VGRNIKEKRREEKRREEKRSMWIMRKTGNKETR